MQFVDELLRPLDTVSVVFLERGQLGDQLLQLADDTVVFLIILAILHMIASDRGEFADALILLPVQEICVLEQLTFVQRNHGFGVLFKILQLRNLLLYAEEAVVSRLMLRTVAVNLFEYLVVVGLVALQEARLPRLLPGAHLDDFVV